MKISKPAHLIPNQKISLIAPSFPFNQTAFLHGIKKLEVDYSLNSVFREDIKSIDGLFAGSSERRSIELIDALTDSKCSAILAVRGGYGCSTIYTDVLKEVKKKKSKLKPKIFIGFSDLTLFLNGLFQELGWITFHGPVLVGRSFLNPKDLEETTFRHTLFTNKPLGLLPAPQTMPLHFGTAQGRIVGGCLSLVCAALGTPYELQTKGKILFLEDVDERPYRLHRMLTQLKDSGSLKKVAGIIIGELAHCYPPEPRPGTNTHPTATTTAEEVLRDVLLPIARDQKIPVLYNFPAGHGATQITFPIGVKTKIQASLRTVNVEFLESGTK